MLVEGMSHLQINKKKLKLDFKVFIYLKIGPRIATPLATSDAALLKSEIHGAGYGHLLTTAECVPRIDVRRSVGFPLLPETMTVQ